MSEILVLHDPIAPGDLLRLARETFVDMVKYVVDVEQGVIAIGGQLHADAEETLLEAGSRPGDLWGANYLLGRGSEDCIEYTSLINIRPARGNPGMEVQDPEIRERIRKLTASLLGGGGESAP